MLYIGADHRGFELKQTVKDYLESGGVGFEDLGDRDFDPDDDYPIFAERVAKAVAENPGNKGIVICGSGAGADMVANKVDGVRCALVFDVERAKQAREHDDANMIALPADALESNTALEMVKAFIETPFSKIDKHERRIEEIKEMEEDG